MNERRMSQLWTDSMAGKIRNKITTTWDGKKINHSPVTIILKAKPEHLHFHIEAPYFNDPPPNSPPGRALWKLWEYEVVEAFFLNDDNQYLEIEIGPHGQHLVLFLHNKRNILRHSLPLDVSTKINGKNWTAMVDIPWEYFPPKVTKYNAYAMHVLGEGRHYESLYPAKDLSEPEFHALQFFKALDLESLSDHYKDAPQSIAWTEAMTGIYRHELTFNFDGSKVTNSKKGFVLLSKEKNGVRIKLSNVFHNDSHIPEVSKNDPYKDLWKCEVMSIYFMNEDLEYLELFFGPHGHYYVSRNLENGRGSSGMKLKFSSSILNNKIDQGRWMASVLVPFNFFPKSVNSFNVYYGHGSENHRQYEALHPSKTDDINYPRPYYPRQDLFRDLDYDFNKLVGSNREDKGKSVVPSRASSLNGGLPYILLTAAVTVGLLAVFRLRQ